MTSSSIQLNDAQRQAVQHGEGPLLIVAGAGTGKTRVITQRIAELLARGVPAIRLLAITFTNKAAREMAGRVERLVPGDRVWVSTFHALAARGLRKDGPRIGVPRDFTICDREDQLSLVRRVLKSQGLDAKDLRPGAVLSVLSFWKNAGRTPDQAAAEIHAPTEEVAAMVYRRYEEELAASHQLDFDDLLLRFRDLVVHPQAGADWRHRFRHVLIDEYQDTNRLQGEIAEALVSETGNVTVCGDPDQSIYSWRGADISNILRFEERFPGTRIVRLEENYRSTRRILELASAVICHNRQRIERGLFSRREDGDRPVLLYGHSEAEEADRVTREILELMSQTSWTPGDFAVLFRTNALSRSFERSFRAAGIPYHLVGAVEFYARKEIRDLLAFLRLKVNPYDRESFLRIVNVPGRGIGEVSQRLLVEAAARSGASAVDVVLRPELRPRLRGAAARGCAELAELLRWLGEREDTGIADLLHELAVRLDYESYLEGQFGSGVLERWDNVRALLADAYEFECQEEGRTLQQYLEERALVQDGDETVQSGVGSIPLMTLHSAKGLEFPVVFLCGLEQNVLPHRRALAEGGLEEERRLFYVGVTRAKQRLYLTCAAQRFQFGRWELSVPSSFLSEVPPDLIDGAADGGLGHAPPHGTYVELDEGEFETDFRFGDRVEHESFGRGEVREVHGRGARRRLRVRFEDSEKTIHLAYTRLRKVEHDGF